MNPQPIVGEEEGRLLAELDMNDPLGDSLKRAEAQEQERQIPVGVPLHPLVPKQPERFKRARVVLKRHPLTQQEWDAIHSKDPYQVYVVRGKPVPIHPTRDTDLRAVNPKLKTRLGVTGSVIWRENVPCPACGAWVCRIIDGSDGGHLCCFGCKNTIETVNGELVRRAAVLKAQQEEAELEKIAPPTPEPEPEPEPTTEAVSSGQTDGLDEMEYPELQSVAKELDIKTTGKKQQLINRIRAELA